MTLGTIEAGAFLSAIVESSSDAIVGKALDGTILTWNDGARRLYGYEAGEIVGRNIAVIIPPERDGELAGILRRIRRGERVEHFETVRVRKDGSRVDVSVTVSPISDGEGRVVGASAIARDVGERKQIEQERARMREELIRAQESLLAELSTPLIPVKEGVLVMPLIGAVNDERARQMLAALLRGVSESGARVAILDVTGVPEVDAHVANALVNAARAARLLGAEVVITGVRGRVAQTLVGMGSDLTSLVIRRRLRDGIEYAEAMGG